MRFIRNLVTALRKFLIGSGLELPSKLQISCLHRINQCQTLGYNSCNTNRLTLSVRDLNVISVYGMLLFAEIEQPPTGEGEISEGSATLGTYWRYCM